MIPYTAPNVCLTFTTANASLSSHGYWSGQNKFAPACKFLHLGFVHSLICDVVRMLILKTTIWQSPTCMTALTSTAYQTCNWSRLTRMAMRTIPSSGCLSSTAIGWSREGRMVLPACTMCRVASSSKIWSTGQVCDLTTQASSLGSDKLVLVSELLQTVTVSYAMNYSDQYWPRFCSEP